MSAEMDAPARVKPAAQWLDLIAIIVCTLAWGTTWFAITLQLGVVDPVISITYRFALAAALLLFIPERARLAIRFVSPAAALPPASPESAPDWLRFGPAIEIGSSSVSPLARQFLRQNK